MSTTKTAPTTPARTSRANRSPRGPGTALAAIYTVFALAAGARAGVQILVDPGRAPIAYLCSAMAAAIYLVGAVAMRRTETQAIQVVRISCALELLGVITIGTLSLAVPTWFPDDTVWSNFGSGYGHVPAVLPLLGLWWARANTRPPQN